jgi:radical SAM superfamily enzyme YgiQ (UPF0313 family)
MNTADWLAYFRQNELDRRGIAWHEGIPLRPRLRGPVHCSLLRLADKAEHAAERLVETRSKDNTEFDTMVEFLAAEKQEHARLLRHAAQLLTAPCLHAPRIPHPFHLPKLPRLYEAGVLRTISGQLAQDALVLNFLARLRDAAGTGVLQTVCDQLLHDLKFHIRFGCDLLNQSPKRTRFWLLLFTRFVTVIPSLTVEHRATLAALDVSGLELVRGSRANFTAVRDAILHGISFALGAAEQVISRKRPSPIPTKTLFHPHDLRVAPLLNASVPRQQPRPHQALLINPFYPKDPHASFGKHVLTPTLALTSIAGATPPNWDVSYWDENLLQGPPPCVPLPQVVGITVHLTFAERAFELARWYRQQGALVVLGGLHALSCPDECAPHADALAIGDGVQLWPQILRDVEAGALQRVYHADYRRPYREDPAPRRELVPRWGFLTSTSLIATRGCHNRCGFCYLSTDGLHMPYLMRDPEQIVQEFAKDRQPYGVFIDNNLGSRPEYLRKLCRALRPLEKIWSAAITIDVTDQPALVREMALAGCTGVFIGFESLSDDNLVDAHKRTSRTEDYGRRVRILHDNGIQVNGSFVLGFDLDRQNVFEKTAQWIEDHRLECATFHILTPYPGTPLYKKMETEKRLLHRNWNLYDTAHVVFQPRHMTPEELADGYAWCYERLFSHRSIWKRRPVDASAVLPYLAMSYLYKRSNRFWHLLIRHRLQHTVWHPLVEYTRQRHVCFRRRLETSSTERSKVRQPQVVVSAGV